MVCGCPPLTQLGCHSRAHLTAQPAASRRTSPPPAHALHPRQCPPGLQEGAAGRVVSASVEITFDNSDGRLPVDAPSVTVGRTLGVKKDEFFLNGKAVKKGDVTSLLESAGFSRSNPYYIVGQNRVQLLAQQTDAQRLTLLKEVAGTNVYEERRAASLAILEETSTRRAQIEELLDEIDDREWWSWTQHDHHARMAAVVVAAHASCHACSFRLHSLAPRD